MRIDHWLVVLSVFHAGCVSITSNTRLVEYPEGARHITRVVAGSRTYEAAADVEVVNLVVTLSAKETCEEADVPVVHRTRVTTKTQAPSHFGITEEFLAGFGGLALGGLALINPERACTTTGQTGAASTTDPQSCTALSWALAGVGALITTVAIIDTIRATDSEQDLGTHDGEYEASTHECHVRLVPNTTVELRLGEDALSLPGKTSQDGKVTFSMIDTWEGVLPSAKVPAKLWFGDKAVVVALTDKQGRELSARLRDNPRSRIAHDVAEAAQRSCDQAINNAQQVPITPDSDDVAISASLEAWQRAKTTCATRWTADHQRTAAAAEQAITENRIGAVAIALKARDLDRVDEVLATSKEAAASLRDDPKILQLLGMTVGEPTRALVSREGAIADSQHRLCRARQIFVRIRGADRWDLFKAGVARNVSDLTGRLPSMIVRLMDAARCE